MNFSMLVITVLATYSYYAVYSLSGDCIKGKGKGTYSC